jgi:hypothetical protein
MRPARADHFPPNGAEILDWNGSGLRMVEVSIPGTLDPIPAFKASSRRGASPSSSGSRRSRTPAPGRARPGSSRRLLLDSFTIHDDLVRHPGARYALAVTPSI